MSENFRGRGFFLTHTVYHAACNIYLQYDERVSGVATGRQGYVPTLPRPWWWVFGWDLYKFEEFGGIVLDGGVARLRNEPVLLISAPRLGVYYFLSLTLSVRLSVCHTAPSNWFFFLFLDGIEPFLAVISPCDTLQTVVLRFWFRPPTAQNLLPKIAIAQNRL